MSAAVWVFALAAFRRGLVHVREDHRGRLEQIVETSGLRTDHFGTELLALADRELVPNRIVGALNLFFANDRRF
jgi:hypothetical protein